MPIKDPTVYPDNWREFSQLLRFERAEGICECQGECGVDHKGRCLAKHKETGKMGRDGIWRTVNEMHGLNSAVGEALYDDEDLFGSRVILTTAHLNRPDGVCNCRELTGMLCTDPDHCLAMCNGCHLRYDHAKHMRNAADTRATKKDAARPLFKILREATA